LYRYCGNNPISYRDPSGMTAELGSGDGLDDSGGLSWDPGTATMVPPTTSLAYEYFVWNTTGGTGSDSYFASTADGNIENKAILCGIVGSDGNPVSGPFGGPYYRPFGNPSIWGGGAISPPRNGPNVGILVPGPNGLELPPGTGVYGGERSGALPAWYTVDTGTDTLGKWERTIERLKNEFRNGGVHLFGDRLIIRPEKPSKKGSTPPHGGPPDGYRQPLDVHGPSGP
jgi:hypothetical protein